jgi:vanillate monooxygenase ferredoxin subunit
MTDAHLLVRVARKKTEADGICSLELVLPSGAALPAFTAGSHIDVQLPGGLTRQYSLCNNPSEAHRYVIAVLRDPASRGGSEAVHALVKEGDTLHISVPKNHFPLASDAKRHLLLAGGIGVTPLLAMAEQLSVQGAAFDLHYCARSKSRAAFIQHMADAPFAAQVHGHWDDTPEQPAFDVMALLKRPEAGVHVYVCGPKGFMDAVLSTARAAGAIAFRVFRCRSCAFGVRCSVHRQDRQHGSRNSGARRQNSRTSLATSGGRCADCL